MLVSWIHPCVCNNLLLFSWPFSSNPLIIVVACLCVYIHQTHFLHHGHNFGTRFKRLDTCWWGGSESYSCWVLPVFWKEKARGNLLFVAFVKMPLQFFCLNWRKVALFLQRGILPTLVNTKVASVLYFCNSSKLLLLRCLGFLIKEF